MSKDSKNPTADTAYGDDARLNRNSTSGDRPSRSQDERSMADSKVSKEDRLAMFRNQLFNSALPQLPDIPGYHLCWLTTTNPRDSIIMRQRLGYELLKSTDFPGFELVTQKTGDFAGCIAVNEMLAAKLPLDLYEMYMTEAHHNAPNAEEEKLRTVIDTIAQAAQSRGAEVIQEEGHAELGKNSGRPSFQH